ncbi:fatty acyl-CoA reductase 2 [Colletotrichum spaethianum]|uniref:Fatty acyl-CoA reductase n=1 Tax=Colletotrichum spaethianum TaxID=700344 RepID=A0AA37LF86_9PEZI|nr:fatty acyl-CoA reductase 2 [Colletotrichum spaethianum]GKT44860.1 fatty acyl-CoA reductase 2 [Colletotrichum spaethianum]
MDFFRDQVVLLTGATGGLGGCLLYKLVVVLRVPKIYVVIRKTPEKAIQAWAKTMQNHVDEIMHTGSVKFIYGDITTRKYGIADHDVRAMENDVTIVINAAANISLRLPLRQVVQENCLSALDLGEMAMRFTKLISFVQLSSAYALSDLPDGPMEEKLYLVDDADQLLEDIISGKTDNWAGFAWPYAKSKRLMECLMDQKLAHRLPLLIGYTSGKNIVDEIPVDLVSNIILQHVSRGTRGVVHTSSQCYIPRTFDDYLNDLERYVPDDWKPKMARPVFTTDRTARQCRVAEFYVIKSRNWLVRADRSRDLEQGGPLGLHFGDHNIQAFTEKRVRRIFTETKELLEMKEKRAKGQQLETKL